MTFRDLTDGGLRLLSLVERLIARQNAELSGANLTALQAEIVEELIVERAEMLLPMKWRGPRVATRRETSVASEWCQPAQHADEAALDQMPKR